MAERQTGVRHVEQVMGTVFSFDLRHPATPDVDRAVRDAVAWLHHVDRVFSTYRSDSAISRLGRGEATLEELVEEMGDEVRYVLDLCAWAERRSRGCFTAYPGGRLDPSGLVKGWAVEEACRILAAAGVDRAYVNGGGDLQLGAEPSPGRPWRVGIADPTRAGELLTVVTGRDLAVATSGSAERGAHIVDPRTGAPASGLLSATVIGPRLTWADAYATAAVVMGPEALDWIEDLDGYELLAVSEAGDVAYSTGFPRPVAPTS
ncbi:FAD:protein FMN transferase [Streptomyces sp. NPDC058001]|uniref:FAD:protein FMN transferase n=1 Tax=Streptomyces sp. NPDC058001 TaxID=3346300 RepID=UPI0036F161E0